MPSAKPYVLIVMFVIFLTLSLCQALELEEIRPWSANHIATREIGKRDLSALDLKSTQTFLWGSEDGPEVLLGNLTVFMPNENENVLSMEKFDGMLTSVKCSPHDMELKFDDDGSFAYAQRVWDWVNGADNHTFVMVTGKGDCGPNSKRTPYLVSSITYDEKHNIAHLEAVAGTWKDLAHSYELRVGKIPMTRDLGLLRRDYTKDAYLNLAANLGTKVKVETGPINGELVCDPCYTAGRMHFELVITTWAGIPNGAVFRLSPEGVKVAATLKFSFTSNFGAKTKLPPFSFPQIPLGGISIPGGILTLGPVLEVTIGGEVKAEGTVSVTAGASATLSDSALLQVDLLSPGNNEFSSWQPDISAEPLQMQAKASATWKQFLEPFLKLEAEALGQGFDAGVSLRMPFVEVKAEGIVAQNGGACKKGDPYDAAVRVVSQWGFELKFRAGKIGDEGVDVTLGSAAFPIGQPACFGWDIEQNGGSGGSPSAPPPPPTSGTPPPPPASGGGKSGNPCTNSKTGISGTCLSTSECKDAGNESAPGYCPDDPPDVQCCTDSGSPAPSDSGPPASSDSGLPAPSTNTCKVGNAAGECIPTESCKSSGKRSTPGYCPDDPSDDVQCCTYSSNNTCKVGEAEGDCISTAACKSSDKKSTPGYCPDDPPDIQCCTFV